jgi:exonuclease SbcC
MIPVSLTLQNFLSYGEEPQTLRFDSFQIACLTGPNGAGKSSMIEAITWALWGKARQAKGNKSANDSVVRINADLCQVVFTLDIDGERYQVLRRYERSRSASTLKLSYADEAGQFKPVAEGRAAQTKIDQILKLKYDSFLNASFLMQGQADLFMTKSPRERKVVLADILGLSRYDELLGLAKANAKVIATNQAVVEDRLGVARVQLEKLPELEESAKTAADELGRLSEERRQLDQRRTELLKSVAQLDERRAARERLKREMQAAVQQMDKLVARREQIKKQVATDTDLEQRRAQIENDARLYRGYVAERDLLDSRLAQLRELEAEEKELNDRILSARRKLESELHAAELDLSSLRARLDAARRTQGDAAQIEAGFARYQRQLAQEREQSARQAQYEEQQGLMQTITLSIAQERSRLEADVKSVENQCAALRRQTSGRDAAELKLAEAKSKAQNLVEAQTRLDDVRDEGNAVKVRLAAIESELIRLSSEAADTREKLRLMDASPDAACPLCGQPLDAGHRAEIEAQYNAALRENQVKTAELEAEKRQLAERREALLAQYRELSGMLAGREANQQELAVCEGDMRLVAQAENDLEAGLEKLQTLQKKLDEEDFAQRQRGELRVAEQHISALGYDPVAHAQLRQECQRSAEYAGRLSALEASRAEEKWVASAMPELAAKVEKIQLELNSGYPLDLSRILAEVSAKKTGTGYDAGRHLQVRTSLQALDGALVAERNLEEASRRLVENRNLLAELEKETAAATADNEARADALRRLEQDLNADEQVRGQLSETERLLKDNEVAVSRGQASLGAAHEALKRLNEVRAGISDDEARQRQLAHDAVVYRLLIEAFSPSGIPALIIENALPQIEAEANELLARLTHDGTQITIEQEREKKTGGVADTLEIKVSDALGARDIEMYSGGEAFRINFALRIALSKLLANRAGTSLRTLVIDEGFGTQDADGLQNLVEAIQAVAQDFDKILVITHLEALKNAFPVQITVNKDPDPAVGSRFTVQAM